MSLQFYFGPSGAGKSRQLHMDMLKLADEHPEKNILFLVPDQFTMQTQFDLVNASSKKGIRNIDVLSFGRLSHRIFEETGMQKKPVLDDTGKSLVLRKVAASISEELPVIGPNLGRIGYIHEVKSAISEFMQYGLSPKEVAGLAEYAKGRGALNHKLKDLQKLYDAFLVYIKDSFITTEETLDLLTQAVEQSEIIKDSVVVFDGFTGFTPIQNRLIQKLMTLTEKVIVSITIDAKEDPFLMTGEQSLFYLSKKTVHDLCKLAAEAKIGREEDVFLRPEAVPRFQDGGQLAHLEKHLFRYPVKAYEGSREGGSQGTGEATETGGGMQATSAAGDAIRISEAANPAREAKQVCMEIKELVLSGQYAYRDIAVVAGDLGTYADYLQREGARYDIPMFMDMTRGLLLNPFIEFIRSGLKILLENFSYEAIFHYLRSGLVDFSRQEVDLLENYVLSLGLKGKRKWQEVFTRLPQAEDEEKQMLLLTQLNEIREKLMEQLSPLLTKKQTAGEHVRALYDFIVAARIQEKLAVYENHFKEKGDFDKAKEYAQIYRLVMELLEQIEGLLSKEEMSLQEFADILDAGFGEIEIGIIPGGIDRVVVGDMERTRLKQVKVLFFIGVNDGNIPKSSSKGGIISDIDREFLHTSEYELAPTPRQQMYIQRLYLYMNMTKPSEKLLLSYSAVSSEGKSIRPSYLVEMIKKLFPGVKVEQPKANEAIASQIVGEKDGVMVLAEALRAYREGGKSKMEPSLLAGLLKVYQEKDVYADLANNLCDAAFMKYTHSPLSKAIAGAIYGRMLENSVSRLEKFASCAYAHFLQYGLRLQEREEYLFEPVDLGNIYHSVLELFAAKLEEKKYTWFDFPKEEAEVLLREALESCAVSYGETILYSSARYEYMLERIYRILERTVFTLQSQLKAGSFRPAHFELSFSKADNLEAVNITLSEEEKMKLRGRIDRVDVCEDDEHVYVKVIDYKSGDKQFDLAALYYGLQLQLVVYMNVATQLEQKKHPDKEVVPAALLYYHVQDPVVAAETELTPEEINVLLQEKLRMTGIVSEREPVADLLDKEFTGKSMVIPVKRKTDGSFDSSSHVITEADYQIVSGFVNQKIKEIGRDILKGSIEINPYEYGDRSACTYCDFKSVCGYDEKVPGYRSRVLPKEKEDVLLLKMSEELKETKNNTGN